jgi:hypothetical protein
VQVSGWHFDVQLLDLMSIVIHGFPGWGEAPSDRALPRAAPDDDLESDDADGKGDIELRASLAVLADQDIVAWLRYCTLQSSEGPLESVMSCFRRNHFQTTS